MNGVPQYPTYADLAGKVAVVTGGSRGIGAETARALAGQGVAVAVLGRDQQALDSVAADVNAGGGRALAVRADVTIEAEVQAAAAAVHAEFGAADILAPFAGGGGFPVPTLSETSDHWREVLESDLTSTFLTVAAFVPPMVERRRGSVITMASAAARRPARSNAAYAAAKAGVLQLTRHLAGELAGDGIRVNGLAPSAVENEKMRNWMSDEQRQQLIASIPLGRIGAPRDVAAAVLFFASETSSWITGVTLDIAGGQIIV